jgi:phage tail-like protein
MFRRRARDASETFGFRVKWGPGEAHVAGAAAMSSLERATDVVEYREGHDPSGSRKVPARTDYETVTLGRGVTHDVEFARWASLTWKKNDPGSPKDFRKDLVIIDQYDEAGRLVNTYKPDVLHR